MFVRPASIVVVVALAGLGLYLVEESSGPLGPLAENYLVIGVFALIAPLLSAWLD